MFKTIPCSKLLPIQCPSTCPKQPVFIPSTNSQSSQSAPAPAALPAAPIAGGSAPAPQIPTTAYSEGARRAAAVRTLQQLQALRYPRSTIGQNITQHLVLPQGIGRQRMYAATIRAAGVGQYQAGGQGAQVATYTNIGARPKYPPPPTVSFENIFLLHLIILMNLIILHFLDVRSYIFH